MDLLWKKPGYFNRQKEVNLDLRSANKSVAWSHTDSWNRSGSFSYFSAQLERKRVLDSGRPSGTQNGHCKKKQKYKRLMKNQDSLWGQPDGLTNCVKRSKKKIFSRFFFYKFRLFPWPTVNALRIRFTERNQVTRQINLICSSCFSPLPPPPPSQWCPKKDSINFAEKKCHVWSLLQKQDEWIWPK